VNKAHAHQQTLPVLRQKVVKLSSSSCDHVHYDS